MLTVAEHPLLAVASFESVFPRPLAECPSPPWLAAMLTLAAAAPLRADDALRTAVRGMLRHGGFKPSGRAKPASEYLVRATGEGALGSINAAVDACNVVSLHSGFPISVVDLDLARPPLHVAIAPEGASYVFNASGQEMDLGGLVCLYDQAGPCGNAVKDSQRTKTSGATIRTFSVLWGVQSHAAVLQQAAAWYRELLGRLGVETH
ncbi:MAG: phenylalanine--tRNA ligase beta subunit-related protein [Candidatus Xenobia bacterium]